MIDENYLKEKSKVLGKRTYKAVIEVEGYSKLHNLNVSGTIKGSFKTNTPLSQQVLERTKGALHPDIEVTSYKIVKELNY